MSTTRKIVIMLGAPLVFLGGLGVYWGVGRGMELKERVEQWIDQFEDEPGPVTMDVSGMPIVSTLHVDGQRLGGLGQVVILRQLPGTVDSLRLTVAPADGFLSAAGGSCLLRVDPGAFDHTWPLDGWKNVLTCEADSTDLVRFGTLVIEGRGERAIYLESGDVPCVHMGDQGDGLAACDDIRVRMERLKENIRVEVRENVRNRVRVEVN